MGRNHEEESFKTIIVEAEGPVARIIINRPTVMNALNSDVIEEIDEALAEHIDPVETRVIIFEGAGNKAFVAGADISQMTEMTPEMAHAFAIQGQALTKALETLPQIVIAKVRGFALGGGCELAMACDIIIAAESARFGQPEVNLGLIPGFGGTQRLARRVGLPLALDMICTGKGRTLTGAEAYSAGLVSRVVPDDKLDAEVDKVVGAILKAGPAAVAESKRLVRESYMMNLEAGLGAEAGTFAVCFSREEARDGISAFLEKRAPSFSQ